MMVGGKHDGEVCSALIGGARENAASTAVGRRSVVAHDLATYQERYILLCWCKQRCCPVMVKVHVERDVSFRTIGYVYLQAVVAVIFLQDGEQLSEQDFAS